MLGLIDLHFMMMDQPSKNKSFHRKTRKYFVFRPTGTRAIRRFIPMMWIDQTIILNNETLNRLHRVSLILAKGHYAHQSLKLVYIVIALLSILAIIIVMELVFFNRRVRFLNKEVLFYHFIFSVK